MISEPVDFLFILMSGPDEHEMNIRLGQLMQSEGFRLAFVTQLRRSARLIRQAGFPAKAISELVEERRGSWISPQLYENIESKYGLISLRDLCFPEARLLNVPEERVYETAVCYLQAFEGLFERWQPRFVVQNSGAELLRRTAYFVARRREITHVFLRPTPFPGRITFSVNSEAGDWTDFHFSAHEELNEVFLIPARSFVTQFREQKARIARVNKPQISLLKIQTFFKLLWWQVSIEHETMGYWNPVWRAKRYVWAILKANFLKAIYQPTYWDVPYIFFPIHVWHDSAITVRAPQFIRQHHLVELISDAIPQGYKLYVKEHPISVGRSPLGAMLRLRKLQNVMLLDPAVSSHQIVEHARAVIVINSTAGFEALAYYKPVIVLGKPFYSRRGVTIDVENLFDLRAAIRDALKLSVDSRKVDAFIYAAYRSTIPGTQITKGGDIEGIANGLVSFARGSFYPNK